MYLNTFLYAGVKNAHLFTTSLHLHLHPISPLLHLNKPAVANLLFGCVLLTDSSSATNLLYRGNIMTHAIPTRHPTTPL